MTFRHAFFVALIASFLGCSQEEQLPNKFSGDHWFTSSSLPFTWQSGHEETYYLPEIIGGGVATIDYDNDGDLDVYCIQGGSLHKEIRIPNQLFRNDGNWNFTDVTLETNVGDTGYGMGVAVGDYDNDGDDDLYITNVGSNTLLRNDGKMFADVTDMAGVGDSNWGSSTSFVDIDNDNDLDLFVVNYLGWSVDSEMQCYLSHGLIDYCSPSNYLSPMHATLYQNNGNGTFTDISSDSGISMHKATGLGVTVLDFNQDGFQDLFVANDGMPDYLWRNNGNNTFSEIGSLTGCNLDNDGSAKAGMGVTSADLDDDGDFEIYVCNMMGESDSVFENHGEYFIDVTNKFGLKAVSRIRTRFGIGLKDFNNDGFLDLFEANGKIAMNLGIVGDKYAEENLVLRGSERRFTPLSTEDGTEVPTVRTSRGASFADLDNDGDTDVIVINKDAPATLYINTTSEKNWIGFDLKSDDNSPLNGTIITAKIGERLITRKVSASGSYLSSSDTRILIGLGSHTSLEKAQITWPDGTNVTLHLLHSGSYHQITK
jgi:hypothetical protein